MQAICLRGKFQTAALTTEQSLTLPYKWNNALFPMFEYILYTPRHILRISTLQQSYVSTETEVKIYPFIARRRRA